MINPTTIWIGVEEAEIMRLHIIDGLTIDAAQRVVFDKRNKPQTPMIHTIWATGHDINCEWQLDQYDSECNCGATRPRMPGFVEYESYKKDKT